MTSPGAYVALMYERYRHQYGVGDDALAALAINNRAYAQRNPRAVMRTPLTREEYLSSRFIAEPLRLYDYCLINDGGVALLLTTAERARRLPQPLVTVAGLGRSDLNRDATTLRPRLEDFYHCGHTAVAEQVSAMSGLGPEDIDVLGIYDSFSIHIPVALEGFGFCPPGQAPALARSGLTGPGGRLPVNTSGGNLSESYMQGWNHQVELIRQLRHQTGARQVEAARTGQYLSDVAGSVMSIVYRRGAS
jgi:acetyl-CoA acetyltransferase